MDAITAYLPVLRLLVIYAFVGAITPGPNNFIVMSIAGGHGYRKAMPYIFGVTLGFPLLIVACAIGLSAIFTAVPVVHRILQYVGAVWLLIIAWRIATSNTTVEGQRARSPMNLWQAIAFQWANPKAWIIAIGQLGIYTQPGRDYPTQMALIVGVNLLIACLSQHIWALGGAGIARLLRTQRARRIFNIGMGLMLAVSVIGIFL